MYFNLLLKLKYDCEKKLNTLKFLLDLYISNKIFISMVFVLHQIELDLLRTLPNNRHYASVDSPGICKLRNVLLAYSWHNPSIGYCQVGVALTLNSYSRSKSVDSYSDYLPVPLPMFASYISNLHVIPPSSHFNSILTKIH